MVWRQFVRVYLELVRALFSSDNTLLSVVTSPTRSPPPMDHVSGYGLRLHHPPPFMNYHPHAYFLLLYRPQLTPNALSSTTLRLFTPTRPCTVKHPLFEESPGFVSDVVTLDNTTFTILLALFSGTAAVSCLYSYALLETGPFQSFAHQRKRVH